MSKTKFVRYADEGFWAYDVALDIFLKHLLDAAETTGPAATARLSGAISEWRLACVPDYGLTLDSSWSSEQQQTFLALAEDACARLAARASIPAEEIVSWEILEDVHLYTRGQAEVLTAPVIELGRAIIALVCGQLPEPPEGQIWLYGAPEGRLAIGCNKLAAQPPVSARVPDSNDRKFRGIFSFLSTVSKFLRRSKR